MSAGSQTTPEPASEPALTPAATTEPPANTDQGPAVTTAAAGPRGGLPPGARMQQVLTWAALILIGVSIVWLVVAIAGDDPDAAPVPTSSPCAAAVSRCALS